MIFQADNFDEIQRQLLAHLHDSPDCTSNPRGMAVRESLVVTVRLSDPRARLSTSPARAANYGFAAGEFLWYLRGAEDLESIAYYNRRMAEFSDDGVTLASAYGKRLGMLPSVHDGQWGDTVDTLVRDPDSRRAVMTIYAPVDLFRAVGAGTKDVPCTLSLQFLARDGRLHLHVSMRSNDAVWGLCNDLFSFTLLQEVMLLDLRAAGLALELGDYVHTAGSMHIYERHFGLASVVAGEAARPRAAMPPLTSPEALLGLLADESALRGGGLVGDPAYARESGEGWLFDRLLEHRLRRDAEADGMRWRERAVA